MAFDFKKEYKEFYLPPAKPGIVTVPPVRYLAVRGEGDPNDPQGAYRTAVGQLYGVAYTVKMSKMGDHRMDGYFDFVVPPLEGFWQQEGIRGIDYGRKDLFRWISVLRIPDFVTEEELRWAKDEAERKKKTDFSPVEILAVEEGLSVQCMHLGPYDDEPATVERMHAFLAEQGYAVDLCDARLHHEIYLSDPNKTPPEKRKTVLRHPIRPL